MSDAIVVALITAMGALVLGVLNVVVTWRTNSKKKAAETHKEVMIRLDNIDYKLDKTVKGLQANLRSNLYSLKRECVKKGYADDTDRANFLNMYDKYHDLYVNGVMDHVKEEFLKLPLKKPQRIIKKREALKTSA